MNKKQLTFTNITESENRDNDKYPEFLDSIKNHFNTIVGQGKPLFTTNSEGLWEAFLNNLPQEARQHYTCRTCKHFVERYGSLVTINENGEIDSVLWGEVPEFFTPSINTMKKIVLKSKVNGVFLSEIRTLGQPVTGEWHHMSATLPNEMIYRSRLQTVNQAMSEKLEDYRTLNRGLVEYPVDSVLQAVNLLKTEVLYRSERCLGVAEWLYKLHENRNNTSNSRAKENITWLAVATAPNGFCHVKSSMIGTLLDDISEGLSFESVGRRFAEKMNPSNYMRSQVAPTQGNIQEAEKIVEKMGIANSLKRRYAKFEEIPYFIWKNNRNVKENTVKNTGVFSNITPRGKNVNSNNINLPTTVMTWDKFQRTVVPTAENIEVKVDNTNRLMALVTASDEASPNILQWDNSFSWYYHGGIDGEIKRRVENAGGRYENNEIRCSLIWEGYTDLDLHCVTPRGEHIYFSSKKSRSGGFLDIDMNGLDRNSETPVENIRFSDNAPTGHYRFYVHNYAQRSWGNATPFKVELEVNGKIYSCQGEPLRSKDAITVFEFDYAKGQQLNIASNSSNISSNISNWNIPINDFIKVNGITNSPNLWNEEQVTHSGNHTFFLLDGCRDLSQGKGRGFFSETLKPELREIRKTLEAYTANTPIENIDGANACGIGYSKDSEWELILKVTSNKSTRIIKIDRWD